MKEQFPEAVRACPALSEHLRAGWQAVRSRDRRRLHVRSARSLTGSIDLDAALAEACPNDPRWDYGIGCRRRLKGADVVHWIEVHPATERGVHAVERKLAWLKTWRGKNAPQLARLERRFVWIASGETQFTAASPGLRRLASRGCRFAGRRYTIE